jgi:hypothetical protein
MLSFSPIVAVLLGAASSTGITGVRITEVTPTQAILRYSAPDAGVCTLEVSESARFTPLVHDVDPGLYARADRDDRPENLTSGNERVFVIGKRAAMRAADGRMYSRALQTNTRHYYRLRCGTEVWTSDFSTANLAVGNTAPDPYPADPDNPGEYAWPNMNFAAGTNEKHVDPQTGILINRLTGPQSFREGDYYNFSPLALFDRSGGRNPWRFRDGTAGATYTADGSTPAKLYVPLDLGGSSYLFRPAATAEAMQLDWLTVTLRGSAGAGGADGILMACLTTSGVDCIAGSATAEVDLHACGAGCTLGDTRSELAAWSTGRVPPFSSTDLSVRKTVASYDAASGTLTWTSGNQFHPDLTAGSKLWIDRKPYTVRAAAGTKSVTLDAGLNLSSPVTVISSSFGVLLWKKAATSGTSVRLEDLKFNLGAPCAFSFWDLTGANHCHPETVQYAGQDGYHCVLTSAYGLLLAWINRTTGDANLLGQLALAARPDSNGWPARALGSAAALFDGNDPNVMYGVIRDTNNKDIVVRMTYTGDNSPVSGGVRYGGAPWSAVANLTPASPNGYDLEALIQRFDQRYDPALFQCAGYMMDVDKLVINCNAGQDQTPGGWVVIFDPKITPGPNTNPVIAAVSSYGPKPPYETPLRWCVLHSLTPGDPGWVSVAINSVGYGATFTTTLAQPAGPGDTDLHLTGEPGGGALDSARVGDYFLIENEVVRITGKASAHEWTVERGQERSAAAAHAAGAAAVGRCSLNASARAGDAWWHYTADPHGWNASGKTVDPDTPHFINGHGVFALGNFTRVIDGADCGRDGGSAVCLQNRAGSLETSIHGPASSYVNLYPAFAGITTGVYGFGSHASRLQMSASDTEKQWVIDSHPIAGGTFLSAPVSKVPASEQLYTMKRTLNTKRLATYAACGAHPLVDVSGPASTLADGRGDAYKYCVPNAPGECRKDSSVGQVYFNCPGLQILGCNNGQYDSSGQNAEDVCIFDGTLGGGAQVMQWGTAVTDRTGAYARRITHGFARYRQQEEFYYSNGKALPGGEWALFLGRWIDGQRSDIYAAKLPPFQMPDGLKRNTFLPLEVAVGRGPAGTSDAVIEFGYDPQYRCTSRREACVATSPTVDEKAPFYWAGETYKGPSCATGCTIAIPAISQRVVYYRVKYRRADGSTAATGKTRVLAAP